MLTGAHWGAITYPVGGWATPRRVNAVQLRQPVLVLDQISHRVLLSFGNITYDPSGQACDRIEALHHMHLAISTSAGASWGAARDIRQDPAMLRAPTCLAPTSGTGIQLRHPGPHVGRLLWTAVDQDGRGVLIMRSDDGGESTNFSSSLYGRHGVTGYGETSIAELAGGSVIAIERNSVLQHKGEPLAMAISRDGGKPQDYR